MKQSRASHSSSPSCIWGTGKPTGALAMITVSTNNLYGHRVDNTRKWREQFVQLSQFVLKHKLIVLWTKPPDFRLVFVYFWHHVNRLGNLQSKEQQLSRTQHFILKAHAAIFVLHIQYAPRGTPLTSMIQRQNCLLSTLPWFFIVNHIRPRLAMLRRWVWPSALHLGLLATMVGLMWDDFARKTYFRRYPYTGSILVSNWKEYLAGILSFKLAG